MFSVLWAEAITWEDIFKKIGTKVYWYHMDVFDLLFPGQGRLAELPSWPRSHDGSIRFHQLQRHTSGSISYHHMDHGTKERGCTEGM